MATAGMATKYGIQPRVKRAKGGIRGILTHVKHVSRAKLLMLETCMRHIFYIFRRG